MNIHMQRARMISPQIGDEIKCGISGGGVMQLGPPGN